MSNSTALLRSSSPHRKQAPWPVKYTEFVQEDLELAEAGMADYYQGLLREEWRADVPVTTARQILALNDKAVSARLEAVWGKITPASPHAGAPPPGNGAQGAMF